MARFDSAIATALRLIKKNGQAVEWIKEVVTTPDPAAPWDKTSTPSTVGNPFICFLPLDSSGKQFLMSLGIAPEVAVGSYYGLMGAVDFDPSPEDTVLRDGVSLEIVSVDLLSPNGQKVLWTVVFNK